MRDAELEMLLADRWFGEVSPDCRALLLREAKAAAFADGGRIYGLGDPPNGLWAVLDGQVRLKSLTADGFELLALIVRPGTWFGELSTLDGEPRPHEALAFGETRLLNVAMSAVVRIAAIEPALYRYLGLLVCAHQRTALRFISQNAGKPVRARLARTLLRSSLTQDGWLKIRQDELAAMVGVTRQTLNRHLKSFERGGLIEVAYAQVRILDIAGLGAIETLTG